MRTLRDEAYSQVSRISNSAMARRFGRDRPSQPSALSDGELAVPAPQLDRLLLKVWTAYEAEAGAHAEIRQAVRRYRCSYNDLDEDRIVVSRRRLFDLVDDRVDE